MRYSTDLCKEEKKFILRRKEFVFEAMRKFLGDCGPQTVDEVSENRFDNTTIDHCNWMVKRACLK